MGSGHPSLSGKLLKRAVEEERDADAGTFADRDGSYDFECNETGSKTQAL